MMLQWPPDYTLELMKRQQRLDAIRSSDKQRIGARMIYESDPATWIDHWCVTVDPRIAGQAGRIAKMPFVLFPRQREFIYFLKQLVDGEASGLIEKSRDMGATWLACCFSVWLWIYRDAASIGWGSRKADLVDRIGDMDSIFEKLRTIIASLPDVIRPSYYDPGSHANYMKIVNPNNASSITGESGDDIGRGGRKLIYFKDESAHYEHPEAIEASLTDNTRIQVDISSVCGFGTVFERKRVAGADWAPGQGVDRGKTNVFVFDWRSHPEKTQEWYDRRKKQAEDEGLLHIFAQEVDRDYSASLEGVVIPAPWVRAAIDAHVKLGLDDSGGSVAGLDVADEGGDTNALAVRRGIVLKRVEEWGNQDTGVTTRRAADGVKEHAPIELQYDCVGVGAGVKGEANRLARESYMPEGVRFVPWNAGGEVLDKERHFVPHDKSSPKNEDLFGNLKAQAWWSLRRKFEITWRAVRSKAADATLEEQSFTYDPAMIVSLPSTLPLLFKLCKELSQATISMNSRMKMIIDKKPDGAKSPNLADAVVMAYFPMKGPIRVAPGVLHSARLRSGPQPMFNRSKRP